MRLVMRPPTWWWKKMADSHELRREAAQALRLSMQTDLPVYGVQDGWVGTREVRIGLCRAAFRRGPMSLRMPDGGIDVDEITARHETPDGGTLAVTSHRGSPEDIDRNRLVHNFRSMSWVVDQSWVSRMPHAEQSSPMGQPPEEWAVVDLDVDGRGFLFDRLSMPGHWLALGVIGDHHVSIEGHGVAPEVRIGRIDDIAAWLDRPGLPVTPAKASILEFGDRLFEILGLP